MVKLNTCRSSHRNFLQGGEDELTRGLPEAFTQGSNTTTPSPAVSRAPTPTIAPIPLSTDELFKRFIKTYLESNQGLNQSPEERKRLFKAKVPDIYYGKSHMDCYHFCQ